MLIAMTLILYIIIPKPNKNLLRLIRKSIIFKSFLVMYLFIDVILVMTISSDSLSRFFYQGYPPQLFGIILLIFIVLISKYNIISIINSSYLFFVVVIPLILFNFFSHYDLFDISELRLANKDDVNLKLIVLLLYLTLNNMTYFLFSSYVKGNIKFIIFIPLLVCVIYQTIESLALVSLFGDSLIMYDGVGFLTYNIEPSSTFIGNFDFVYIYTITASAIFKIVISVKLVEILYKRGKLLKTIFVTLAFIVVFIATKYISDYSKYIEIAIYVMVFLLITFILFMWRSKFGKSNK